MSPNASPSSTTISPMSLPDPESAETSNPTTLTKHIARMTWSLTCQDDPEVTQANSQTLNLGECGETEFCIDGKMTGIDPQGRGYIDSIAWCVSRLNFVQLPSKGFLSAGKTGESIQVGFKGGPGAQYSVEALLTSLDSNTLVRAQSMEILAQTADVDGDSRFWRTLNAGTSHLVLLVLLLAITPAMPSPVPPVLAASVPLSLLNPEISNKSLLFSDTGVTTDLANLPDPYDEQALGVSTILEVYDYGRTFTPLVTSMVRLSIRAAVNDFWSHSYQMDRQIGTENVLQYHEPGIWLVCNPRQPLTWLMWYEALGAMSTVVNLRGLRREFHFLILQEGTRRELGYGSLLFDF
ncbi:MAG: hypothetical protein ASARMPRED_004295 [Alectoria sarmentosa]|nr:MAG: hypothetical protein ASARMPRED_004295 [Alectoria sarmentosa]